MAHEIHCRKRVAGLAREHGVRDASLGQLVPFGIKRTLKCGGTGLRKPDVDHGGGLDWHGSGHLLRTMVD
jgi:hypothetical protein